MLLHFFGEIMDYSAFHFCVKYAKVFHCMFFSSFHPLMDGHMNFELENVRKVNWPCTSRKFTNALFILLENEKCMLFFEGMRLILGTLLTVVHALHGRWIGIRR